MEKNKLKSIVESVLFAAEEPLSIGDLKKIEELSKNEIKEVVDELVSEYQNPVRGFELVEIAQGYQFRTKPELAIYVKGVQELPRTKLSSPAMETLAIVAYQQPVPRNKVEEIRGVDSGGVMKTLLDRDLVRIVGRSEEPGRPILYGTTKTFLETFSLSSLSDLPTLKDLEALEEQSGTSSTDLKVSEAQTDESEITEKPDSFGSPDEGASALIDELENSMRSLKDLERKIFPEKEDEAPSKNNCP